MNTKLTSVQLHTNNDNSHTIQTARLHVLPCTGSPKRQSANRYKGHRIVAANRTFHSIHSYELSLSNWVR